MNIYKINTQILYGVMICTGVVGIILAILFKAELINDKYITFMLLLLSALVMESFLYVFIKKEVGIGGKSYTKYDNPIIYYSHLIFCSVIAAKYVYEFVKNVTK